MGSEHLEKTRHPKIFIGKIAAQARERVLAGLERLAAVTGARSRRQVREALRALVPEMRQPDENAAQELPLGSAATHADQPPQPRVLH